MGSLCVTSTKHPPSFSRIVGLAQNVFQKGQCSMKIQKHYSENSIRDDLSPRMLKSTGNLLSLSHFLNMLFILEKLSRVSSVCSVFCSGWKELLLYLEQRGLQRLSGRQHQQRSSPLLRSSSVCPVQQLNTSNRSEPRRESGLKKHLMFRTTSFLYLWW